MIWRLETDDPCQIITSYPILLFLRRGGYNCGPGEVTCWAAPYAITTQGRALLGTLQHLGRKRLLRVVHTCLYQRLSCCNVTTRECLYYPGNIIYLITGSVSSNGLTLWSWFTRLPICSFCTDITDRVAWISLITLFTHNSVTSLQGRGKKMTIKFSLYCFKNVNMPGSWLVKSFRNTVQDDCC